MLKSDFEIDEDNKFDSDKEDPFVYLHRMIKAGVSEVSGYCDEGNAEKVVSCNKKLYMMENTLFLVKGMLKQKHPRRFDKVKA